MNMTTEKQNGKIPFKFTPHFNDKFENSMKLYQMALDKLNDAVNSSTNCDYGYCSNKYSVRLITPNDISTFTSNLLKAFRIGMLQYNIDDIQKFSVESAYRFISEHEDTPFDDTNVLGAFSGTFINPKDFTLTDLLTIAHNEVFPTSLKSNYEIGVQKMNVKEDLRKINDLHFSGVMKNIVKALPRLIDNSDGVWQLGRPLMSETFVNAIEGFIMFAILLNTCTIVGMTNYVDPTVHYNTRELGNADENQVHQESVNTKKNKPVFIILSEGKGSPLSVAIRAKTKSPFTHASIAFDPSLKAMWSYGRPATNPDGSLNNTKFGFKLEDIDERLFRGKHINIGVYAIYLPTKSVDAMEDYIKGYLGVKTKFDWAALIQQLFNKDKEPSEDKYKKICSTFVDQVLKQVGINLTGKNSPNPADFAKSLQEADTNKVLSIFYGDSNNYSPAVAKKKLKQFTTRKTSVTYESFVTECCLLKTDSSIFRSKIPFGCNFRELVLGDMTPNFADLKASIYYIIKNPKSPIAQLLTKYVNVNNICVPDATMVTNMIFKHIDKPNETHNWYNTKTGQRVYEDMYEVNDFHTDVDWLDKIVYGNSDYDSNYRRDNMGNQNVHPILNTLDTIYHIYGDKHLNGNEEIANHIIGVGNVMLAIASAYTNGEIDNYQMTKDVLAVLGEIMTRCILKLYHNNTRVIDVTDTMMDTMAPGYMYVEYFSESVVMEADNNDGKPTVNVNRSNDGSVKNAVVNKGHDITMKLGALISKYSRWIADQFGKIAPKFAEKHHLEYDWVKANDGAGKLNNEIEQSLTGKNFNITVNNYPDYQIDVKNIVDLNNYGDKIKNALADPQFDEAKLFKELLPPGLRDQISYDKNAKQETITKVHNFILHGNPNYQPQTTGATPVTGPKFRELVNNIIDAKQLLTNVSNMSKQLSEAAKELQAKCNETKVNESYEIDSTDNDFYAEARVTPIPVNRSTTSDNKPSTPPAPANDQNNTGSQNNQSASDTSTRIQQVYDVVNAVSQLYCTTTVNVIINKFYKDSYSVYRDIVQAYKQEAGSNNNQPATSTQQSPQTPTNNAPQDQGGENNNG